MQTEHRVQLPSLGFSTRVLRSGEGAPVLLLHGNPDSAGEWLPVMQALGAGHACYAPDLPGFGASDEPPATFDYSRRATNAFLDALIAELRLKEPLVLVVHDIGGVAGIPWAAERPALVRGLVITNTVIFEKFPWFPLAHRWARTGPIAGRSARLLMWAFGTSGGRRFRAGLKQAFPDLEAPDIERMTREFALDPKSRRCTLRLFQKMVPHDYFQGVDALLRGLITQMPVRVVWGAQDKFIPMRYLDVFAGAERERLEEHGHWVPLYAADRVAAAIHAIVHGLPLARSRH